MNFIGCRQFKINMLKTKLHKTKNSSIATEYIGSKRSLIDFITKNVMQKSQKESKKVIDLFSGTGVVSAAFKSLGYSVTANDHLATCFNLTSAVLLNHTAPEFIGLIDKIHISSSKLNMYESVLAYLNNLSPYKTGFVHQNYSPASYKHVGHERKYFSENNAKRIDSIRAQIKEWQAFLTEAEHALLISDLIKAASSVSNVAGTYGCYLKTWKPRALENLILKPSFFTDGQRFGHTVWSLEAANALTKADASIVYADPPYTKRQYAAYYHVLETIVKDDEPTLVGTTGLRNWETHSSKFCYKRHAESALEELLENMRGEHFFMSYNEDGQISHSSIMNLLNSFGKATFDEIQIKRYRSSTKAHRGPYVAERLYHLKLN